MPTNAFVESSGRWPANASRPARVAAIAVTPGYARVSIPRLGANASKPSARHDEHVVGVTEHGRSIGRLIGATRSERCEQDPAQHAGA